MNFPFAIVRRPLSILLSLVLAPAPMFAQQGRPSARAQLPAATIRGFNVVLVTGSMQTPTASDGVPEAARKALADMKDFLPYKRYQLLDAGWMLCCGSGREDAPVSGQLRGPNNQDYTYNIYPLGMRDATMNLRFALREVASVSDAPKMSDTARVELSKELHAANREFADAELERKQVKARFDVGVVTPTDMEKATQRVRQAESRIQELQAMATGKATVNMRSVIDSTFAITPGETVVIGTSRLMGDQALIAILTAATKPSGAR